MREKSTTHLYELAKAGAEARLNDLVHEAKLLIDLFPHLRDAFDKDELPLKFIIRRGADKAKRDPHKAHAAATAGATKKKAAQGTKATKSTKGTTTAKRAKDRS